MSTYREVNVFRSWDEWLDKVENTESAEGSCNHAVSNRPNVSWDYEAGWEGSVKLARDGFIEPLERVEKLATHVESKIDLTLFQTEFQATYDVAGSEVDVDVYLAGTPECMIESTPLRVSKHGRAVRLLVPITCSACVSAEEFERRGAAVVALADLLARAQHPLEVWVAIPINTSTRGYGAGKGGFPDWCDLIRVQSADEPLDVGRLLFAVAHPAAFRRHGFRSMEQSPGFQGKYGKFGSGYGNVAECNAEDLPDQAENTFTLPVLDYRSDWSEAGATKWITGILDKVFD